MLILQYWIMSFQLKTNKQKRTRCVYFWVPILECFIARKKKVLFQLLDLIGTEIKRWNPEISYWVDILISIKSNKQVFLFQRNIQVSKGYWGYHLWHRDTWFVKEEKVQQPQPLLCNYSSALFKNKMLLARILKDLLSQCFETQISYPGADKA